MNHPPLYRPADVNRGCFGSESFSLRFPQIIGSLSDMGFFRTLYHLIRWRCAYTQQGIPKDAAKLEEDLPMVQPNFENNSDKIKYTWIGHSTAVISFGKDANFLIDPVFSERASPFQWIGPKRFRPPACSVQQLPRIDAVLVSHDHYDHLDENALSRLYNRRNQTEFFAGLNSRDAFPKRCQLSELDWTKSKSIQINNKTFVITFVPACHWSRRWLFDKNKRLWGGFVIEAPNGKKVFYSGDTGYCGIFQQLGAVFGGFDLAVLPIGAYEPREYLRNQHVNPEEAVKVHKDIKSKKSVGVHWGTFPLGYEHYKAARGDLEISAQQQGLREDEFVTVPHGGSLTVPYKQSQKMI